MPKDETGGFQTGDRVRIVKGHHRGHTGTIVRSDKTFMSGFRWIVKLDEAAHLGAELVESYPKHMVRLPRPRARQGEPSAGTTTDTDPLSQIAKLGELKDKGYISDEEFQDKKRKLLDET